MVHLKKGYTFATVLAIGLSASISFGSAKTEARKAHLKAAVALAKARNAVNVCENDAYESNLVEAVHKAKVASAGLISASDFDSKEEFEAVDKALSNNLYWREMSQGLKKIEEFKKNLVGAKFNSPSMGVYGSIYKIEVLSDTKAKLNYLAYNVDTGEADRKEMDLRLEFMSTKGRNVHGQFLVTISTSADRLPFTQSKQSEVFVVERIFQDGRGVWVMHRKTSIDAQPPSYKDIKFYNEVVDECEG